MKELFTQSTPSYVQQFAGHVEDKKISRRFFFFGMAAATAVLATAKPQSVLASTDYGAEEWKRTVKTLVSCICVQPQRIIQVVSNASHSYASYGNTFHERFSPFYALYFQVSPERTITDRYFEFDRFPFYDSKNPCRRTKDLNSIEILTLTSQSEVDWYGGVMSPCSERRVADSTELDDFRRTAHVYKTDHRDWNHVYTRNVTNGKKSYLAHAASSRSTTTASGEPTKTLFVSPYDVFN